METAALEAEIAFLKDLADLLDAWDSIDEERQRAVEGRLREGGTLDLRKLGDDICRLHFRFTYDEMCSLALALQLPPIVRCDNDIKVDSMTALAMLLRRLAYPARLVDIELGFGWEATRFSRITRTLAYYIVRRWRHILKFDSRRLTPHRLATFAQAIHLKGAPLHNCWGFIDGTLRAIARPIRNQRIVFNGWKRFHALKYQIVSTPDGIIVHVFGPIEGRRHDLTLFRVSDLEALLRAHSHDPTGQPLCIYGDPAYGVGLHIQSPYKGNVSDDQGRWNTRMSKVREAVEWAFGEVVQYFAFLDFEKNQKVLLQPVGIYYLVAILFTNAHTIFHGNKTSAYFNCAPPTLEEYFSGEPEGGDEEITRMAGSTIYGDIDVQADMLDLDY